jgi:hypothetical protein
LKAVNGEFARIMEIFKTCVEGWTPKFVFVVVDKRHIKRFFFNTGPNRNTAPGSVIDKKFVRVDLHEFFLQAHYPLKVLLFYNKFNIQIILGHCENPAIFDSD